MGGDASGRHHAAWHSAVGLAQVVGWTPPMWSGGRCASRNEGYNFISKMDWRDLIIISFGPLLVPYFAM